MIDHIIGKWRIKRQKGRISTGNSWLVYEIEYNKCIKEKKFPSMREINRVWGGKPSVFRRHKL